jgi:F0F1-type ATP synthase membrane subunit c/vacuolar-type H+-ATPase subunit K
MEVTGWTLVIAIVGLIIIGFLSAGVGVGEAAGSPADSTMRQGRISAIGRLLLFRFYRV